MPNRIPDINLLPIYKRERSLAVVLIILFLLLTLLFYVLLGALYFKTKNDLQAVESTHTHISGEVETLEAKLNTLVEEEHPIEDILQFVDHYHLPTSELITELDELLPDYADLKEYEYANYEVEPTVHFETLNDVAKYTTSLLHSEFIQDTKINTTESFEPNEEEQTDDEVDFNKIPRYKTTYSLKVNKERLKGATERND